MNEFKIAFQEKFTQKDLDIFIKEYPFTNLESINSKIIFDLERLEWISAEGITFLFSEIRKLILSGKNVIVQMPIISEKFDGDNKERTERRKILNSHLYVDWEIYEAGILRDTNGNVLNLDNQGFIQNKIIFQNLADNINKLIDKRESSERISKILPFQTVQTERDSTDAVDVRFHQKIKGKFSIDDEITSLLNNNNCYSPFENKVISHIITKELFMNSAEHSQTDECYFTVALREKWKYTKSPRFVESFINEKEKTAIGFYKDKDEILPIIKDEALKVDPARIKGKITADLEKNPKFNIFKNQSYLEFTFIDFGKGIYNTLQKEYDEKKEKKEIFDNLSNGIKDKHYHSQILEYAFLMDSSKDPFEDRIERADLIPRGLYFLIDMVRRYKGLLVARSGYGKVVYDFSDRIYIKNKEGKLVVSKDRVYVAKDAVISSVKNENPLFEGTMISIILPEREKGKFKKSSVRIDNRELNTLIFNIDNPKYKNDPEYFPAKIYHPEFYEYLNLSFEYQKGEDATTVKEFNSKTGITKLIFKSISDKLKEISGKNCVLFIDFEYIPFRNNNNILKILLYLSNNPMVNERTKVVVLNIQKEDLDLLKEYEISESAGTDDFLLKPIPCVRIDKNKNQIAVISDIQWIGVNSEKDLEKLTDLFFGKIEYIAGYPLDDLKNKWYYEGNIITKHNDRAYSIFTDFQDLINKAKNAKTKQLENWLLNQLVDGSDFENPNDRFYFLTSKGSYQRKYLSLYETLNFKYTSQYFAHYLLDKYIDKHRELDSENFKNISKFNKIIVVTVSSQLLGVEIRNLIKDDDSYDFLRTKQTESKAKISDCPKLIKLASYFSFDSEKPFREINENDRVLIVNDVISTGSLLKRIIDGIKEKNATVSGVISIADSRKSDDEIDTNIEHSSHFLGEIEDKTVSILSYQTNKAFDLKKLKNKPNDVHNVKRINPILNAVVSLESAHTEKLKILFEDPKELFDTDPFNGDIFRIGHFKHNLSHNSYFTNMHNLFYDKNGEDLLKIIKKRIEEKLINIDFSPNDYLTSNLLNLKETINQNEDADKDLVEAFEKVIASINQSKEQTEQYKPTYIFHPVYSGIEELSEDALYDIFKTDKVNILSLQRYETKNGWRFPFPAKRFNKPTKGAHILILDSGSLSGQSLVQLIDSISFLDVGRIDFLSVVSRIDDFQREFYSRLKSIKVKYFDDNDEYHNSNKEKRKKSIINLNVMFGVNLHIPSYIGSETCVYCAELKKLNRYKIDYKDKLPEQALKYIELRVNEEIPLIDNPSGDFKFPTYIPTIKGDHNPDFKEIFSIRDRLGKVDSYRFYVEYFVFFDDISKHYDGKNLNPILIDKELLKKIELILICILHEPHLANVLKDLLSGIYDICIDLVDCILKNQNILGEFNYEWSKYAIIRISFSIKSQNQLALNKFYHFEYFKKLFGFTQGCEKSLNYLSYLLSGSFLKLDSDEFCERNRIESILNELKKNHPEKKTLESRVINELMRKYKFTDIESLRNSIDNLYNFFKTEEGNRGHTEIEQDIIEIRTEINNGSNTNYDNLSNSLDSVIGKLEEKIDSNLSFIYANEKSKNWFGKEYDILFGENKVYLNLKNIIKKHKFLKIKKDFNSEIYKNEAIELSKLFVNFNDTYLFREDSNLFYKFIDVLEFPINAEIKHICKNKNHKDEVEINLILTTNDQIVRIHKFFFKNAIDEIIKNCIQEAKKIKKKLSLTISTQLVGRNQIELKFHQDSPFDNNGRMGDFKNDVEPYFKEFGVENSYEILEYEPNYIFKVNFEI